MTDEGKHANQSMHLDQLNTMRPSASLYIVSIRSYQQNIYVTLNDLDQRSLTQFARGPSPLARELNGNHGMENVYECRATHI